MRIRVLLNLDLHAISDLVKHKDLFCSPIYDGSFIGGRGGGGGGGWRVRCGRECVQAQFGLKMGWNWV